METVLTKVRKLLKLAADQAATEGERDNAMRMAHKLLAKHNLDMVDVDKHIRKEGRSKEELQTFGMKWCRDVAKAMGELFFCKYFYGEKLNATKLQHFFVGKESNAVTASLMTEYVIASILKECRSKYKHNLSPESRNFAIGAADAIWVKVQLMKKEPVPTGDGSFAIVPMSYYDQEIEANMEWLKGQGTELVTVKNRAQGIKDYAAYGAGREYGNGINLNQQVAAKDQIQLENKG
jgi:hypothetical protein